MASKAMARGFQSARTCQACTRAQARLRLSGAAPARVLRRLRSTEQQRTRASSDSSSEASKTGVQVHKSTDAEAEASSSGRGKLIGSVVTVGGLVALIVGAAVFQDPIRDFLQYFTSVVDDMGPLGMVLYFFVYAGLEVLAVPAIPLTMTSGAIFGIVPGSIVVSLAGAVAATISFLIARYVARDRFLPWAEKNKQFRAVNKVIRRDGLKVVTLLRLSPLLPLAASNYLYGLTSVGLKDYFLGSWLGMLPGTVAYVSAGHVSKVAFMGDGDLPLEWWQVGLAAAVSLGVIWYIGSLAKKELSTLDEEEGNSGGGGTAAAGSSVDK